MVWLVHPPASFLLKEEQPPVETARPNNRAGVNWRLLIFTMKLQDYKVEFLSFLHAIGRDLKTIDDHEWKLDKIVFPIVGNKAPDELRLVDTAYILQKSRQFGIHGEERSMVSLRRLLHFIEQKGDKLSINWRDIHIPKVPQVRVEYLLPEELEAIRNRFSNEEDPCVLRTRTLIELMLDTGLRISEAISLNRTDIDYEKKEIVVKNVKSKDIQTVYFTDKTIYWLKKYLESRTDNLECLFVSGRGRLLSVTARNYLRTHTKDFKEKFGKHIRNHIFRRTLATTLVQSNQIDIKSVQHIMRHKSERTTLKYYTGVDERKVKELHGAIMSSV